ncbi:Copper chaperone [Dehalogenimonas alkenigignens]|uniref:Copper chaperone CopZ n=1 Tax=Dehalogenimonas alkenigignens TaxID=1217799 RepID=A0A0W0GL61_9CHLR|nr:cation transporter [Dehalogenimonas alkenigignens]KTB49306.1 Copper chaperone [Dehalogenimonas alkenigignens]
MAALNLTVKGMSCGGCVRHVETALKKVAGVGTVTVDLAKSKASVEYDPAKTTPDALKKAVDASGYPTSIGG